MFCSASEDRATSRRAFHTAGCEREQVGRYLLELRRKCYAQFSLKNKANTKRRSARNETGVWYSDHNAISEGKRRRHKFSATPSGNVRGGELQQISRRPLAHGVSGLPFRPRPLLRIVGIYLGQVTTSTQKRFDVAFFRAGTRFYGGGDIAERVTRSTNDTQQDGFLANRTEET